MSTRFRRFIQRKETLFSLILILITSISAAGCAPVGTPTGAESTGRPFTIGAIPDQDPEKLQRLYGKLADYLSTELGVSMVYRPVTDYTASVTAFSIGDWPWSRRCTGSRRSEHDGAPNRGRRS